MRERAALMDTDGTAIGTSTVSGARAIKVSIVSNTSNDALSERQRILNAKDLLTSFTWSDYGTSNERLASATYTSASVLTGHTVTKTLTYTLVSGSYRLDSIQWSYS